MSAARPVTGPANADIKAQSKVCGYCHIRIENEKFMTAQGNPREDLPAPKIGDSYKAGEDWTTWYPSQAIIPGVHPDQPASKEYVGDLKGLFKLDDHAKGNGIYEEANHHQQSKHYLNADLSCITCHSPHAGKGKIKKVQKDACKTCHPKGEYTVETHMPNTGQTAGKLFMRSHTFGKNPRKGGAGVGDMGPVNYYE
jgi:hypothetical protein